MRSTIIEDEILGNPTKAETDELYDEWCEKAYGAAVEADIESINYIHNPMIAVVQRLVTCPIEGAAPIRVGGASAVVGDFAIESDAFYALDRLYHKKAPEGYAVQLGSKALDLNLGDGELRTKYLPVVKMTRPTDASPSPDLGE